LSEASKESQGLGLASGDDMKEVVESCVEWGERQVDDIEM
jgi:hypothetical protein